jgi:hypothetical protein
MKTASVCALMGLSTILLPVSMALANPSVQDAIAQKPQDSTLPAPLTTVPPRGIVEKHSPTTNPFTQAAREVDKETGSSRANGWRGWYED